MRKALALSIIITVLAVIAYFSKPSEEACLQKAREEFVSKKLGATDQTLPNNINSEVFKETALKGFLESLQLSDRVVLREILQQTANGKKRIGWGAFGFVSLDVE